MGHGVGHHIDISIHALREEGDTAHRPPSSCPCHFYPCPPRGGRPALATLLLQDGAISIHALREEGDQRHQPCHHAGGISIHALREEGDQRHQPCHHAGGISIHALREEGDSPHFFVLVARRVFLSTPSVRRATEPRMGNQQPPAISIHALREEGDSAACRQTTMSIISIHALREEGDRAKMELSRNQNNFYPRPPRGGRLDRLHKALNNMTFLSTPSARRTT